MKILIPILGFGRQGGYRVLSKLADAWLDLGHEVTFLVPETSPPVYFPTRAKIIGANRKGVIRDGFEVGKTNNKITGFDNVRSLFAGLNDVGSRFDLIIANHSLTAWPVRWAKCGSAKKVYYIQAYEPEYYNIYTSPIKHLLAKYSYSLDLVQVSNSRTYPKHSTSDQVGFIPPGVDTNIFFPRKLAISLTNEDVIHIGTIGRTEPKKGTKIALKAFEDLHSANPQFRLRVAFGNLPAGWKHPAAEIVDVKNDDELADFYRSVDIMLVSCVGQVRAPHYPVIESMACGTPVVHTGYFPGNAENSWVVAQKDPQALVDGIHEVVNCRNLEEKISNGLKIVSADLEWSALAARMLFYVHS